MTCHGLRMLTDKLSSCDFVRCRSQKGDLSLHCRHHQEEREASHRQAVRAAVAAALADAAASVAARPAVPAADQAAVAPPQPEALPGSQETTATEPQSLPGVPAVPAVHVKVCKAAHDATALTPQPSYSTSTSTGGAARHH